MQRALKILRTSAAVPVGSAGTSADATAAAARNVTVAVRGLSFMDSWMPAGGALADWWCVSNRPPAAFDCATFAEFAAMPGIGLPEQRIWFVGGAPSSARSNGSSGRPLRATWTLTIDQEGRTGRVKGNSTNTLGKPMSEITGTVRKID
jgi:hypothetical protein